MMNYRLNPFAADWAPGVGAPTDIHAANLRPNFHRPMDLPTNWSSCPFPPQMEEGFTQTQNFPQSYPGQNVQNRSAINPRPIDYNSTDMWQCHMEESKRMYYHYYWYMHNYFQQMQPMANPVPWPRAHPYTRRIMEQSKPQIIPPPTTTTDATLHGNSYAHLTPPPTKVTTLAGDVMTRPHKSSHRMACILCGDARHIYNACYLFDGKAIYFQSAMDGRAYPMRHKSGKDGPSLRDVYFFIYMTMNLGPDQILLHVGSDAPIHVENYNPELRCCDIHIFPGVVVDVLPRLDGTTPISQRAAKIALAPMLSLQYPTSVFREGESVDPGQCPLSTHSKEKSFPIDKAEHASHTEKEEHEELRTVPGGTMNLSTITPASTSFVHSVPPPESGHRDVSRVSTVLSTSDMWTNEVCDESPLNQSGGTALPVVAQKMAKGEKNAVTSPQSVVCKNKGTAAAFHSYPSNIRSRVNCTELLTPTQHSVPSCQMDAREKGMQSYPPATFLDLQKEGTEKEHCRHTATAGKHEEEDGVEEEACNGEGEDEKMNEKQGVQDEVGEEENRRFRTVHIKFFPVTMSFLEIRKMLWSCGVVHKVRLVKPQATTNPQRTFYVCFVEFATDEGVMNALNLHGHRVADIFRLAVERSQQSIRGGYVTDYDSATGKPCTFGLSESERRKVEERHTPAAGSGQSEEVNDTNSMKHESDPRRKRSRRRNRSQNQNQNKQQQHPSAQYQETVTAEGAYALRIVATLGAVRPRNASHTSMLQSHFQGTRSLSRTTTTTTTTTTTAVAAAAMASAEAAETETTTVVPVKAMPQTSEPFLGNAVTLLRTPGRSAEPKVRKSDKATRASVDMVSLREQLRRVAAAHMREQTHLTFYAAVSVMEDLKWSSSRAEFRLAIARCEAALYLYRAQPGDAESATRAAADAVCLGNELSARMAATVSERSGGSAAEGDGAAWRAHFTTISLGKQRAGDNGDKENKEDKENNGDNGEARMGHLYPRGDAVLQFAQVLFHMALLFDDFQLRHHNDEDEECAGAARPHSAKAVRTADALSGAERELLACTRRLLMQLLAEIDAEKDTNTSDASIMWRHRISLVLPHLPRGDGWRPGHLMGDIAPGIRDLSAVTLATCADIAFL